MKNKTLRCACFALGVVINSFGIAFITKGALGTSPISSVPYVLSLRFAPSFGVFSFALNSIFILLQIALLRKDFRPVDFLQFAVNLVFSLFIDLSMSALSWLEPKTLLWQVVSVVAGSAILGFGICLEVAPAVLYVPGDGLVNAITNTFHLRFGSVKVGFDLTLMAIALALSFIFFGSLRGLGIGTVLSALLVGRFVNLFNGRLTLFGRLAALQSPAV